MISFAEEICDFVVVGDALTVEITEATRAGRMNRILTG